MRFKLILAGIFALGSVSLGFLVAGNTKNQVTIRELSAPQILNNTTNIVDKTKYKTSKYNRYDLSPLRTVFIVGEINSFLSDSVATQINTMGADKSDEPVIVVIDSPGGSVIDGAKVVTAIEQSRAPVYTVCVRLCASMAAIIHSYGTKRMATNRSILMYHNASGGAQGELEKMLSALNMMKKFVDKFVNNIVARSTLSFSEYQTMADHELWIDAEDALKYKLLDAIVVLDNLPAATPVPSLDQNRSLPPPPAKIRPNETFYEIVL